MTLAAYVTRPLETDEATAIRVKHEFTAWLGGMGVLSPGVEARLLIDEDAKRYVAKMRKWIGK